MAPSDWEEGTIVLPSAEFAKVRRAAQMAHAEHLQEVFDLTQEFWKGLTNKQQRDRGEYSTAVHEFLRVKGSLRAHFSPGPGRNTSGDWTRDKALNACVAMISRSGNPSRVLKSDMGFPTNRTTEFDAGGSRLTFDKENSTAYWLVDESKGARHNARAMPMAQAFFSALDHIRWTRGTGGVFLGNDEYNGEDREYGGGMNYVTVTFGPMGAGVDPDKCVPYTDSKGKRTTQADLHELGRVRLAGEMAATAAADKAYAQSVKASSAQPRGHNGHAGQYTFRRNAEPGFRL